VRIAHLLTHVCIARVAPFHRGVMRSAGNSCCVNVKGVGGLRSDIPSGQGCFTSTVRPVSR
jgi:hypothetical protein